jgi:O-antigen/teichoic acid export membrane protein
VMLLAPWILKLFGQEFVAGTESLRILCIGQIINASTGSVGLILNMTGHEKYNVMSLSLGTGINLLLNLLLVPQFGLIGAAIAAATSMIVWNLCSAWHTVKQVKINPTAFSWAKR